MFCCRFPRRWLYVLLFVVLLVACRVIVVFVVVFTFHVRCHAVVGWIWLSCLVFHELSCVKCCVLSLFLVVHVSCAVVVVH